MYGIKGAYIIEIVCLLEIKFQCELALHGLKSLQICVEARRKRDTSGPINFASSTEQVRSAYSVLEHSAIAGRFLYEGGRKGKTKQRCAQMRHLLELNENDTPCLRKLSLRNDWEHIDERIDDFSAGWHGDVITYEPPRVEPLSNNKSGNVVFLGVDPEQVALYQLNKFQLLEPIEKEVSLVHDAVWTKGLRKLQEGAVLPL